MDALLKSQTTERPAAAEPPKPQRPPATEAKPAHSRDRIAKAAEMLKWTGEKPTTQVSQPVTIAAPRLEGVPTETQPAEAQEPVTTEAAPAEPEPASTTASVTPKYVELIRKRKELDRKLADAKKVEKQAKELQAALAEFERDPLAAAAKRSGKTPEEIYADLTLKLANPKAAAEKDAQTDLRTKVESIQKQIQEFEAKARAANEQAMIAQAKATVKTHIAQNAEKYEMTAANDATDTVYEVMLQHFNETGEVLPIDKACQMTEQFFEEEADKLLKLKKVQSKLSTRPVSDAPQTGAVTASRTLTNGHTQALPVRANPKLSREQLIREATKHLRWFPDR